MGKQCKNSQFWQIPCGWTTHILLNRDGPANLMPGPYVKSEINVSNLCWIWIPRPLSRIWTNGRTKPNRTIVRNICGTLTSPLIWNRAWDRHQFPDTMTDNEVALYFISSDFVLRRIPKKISLPAKRKMRNYGCWRRAGSSPGRHAGSPTVPKVFGARRCHTPTYQAAAARGGPRSQFPVNLIY